MADEPTGGRKAYGDIAPALGELTDKYSSAKSGNGPASPNVTGASSPWRHSSQATAPTSFHSI